MGRSAVSSVVGGKEDWEVPAPSPAHKTAAPKRESVYLEAHLLHRDLGALAPGSAAAATAVLDALPPAEEVRFGQVSLAGKLQGAR